MDQWFKENPNVDKKECTWLANTLRMDSTEKGNEKKKSYLHTSDKEPKGGVANI